MSTTSMHPHSTPIRKDQRGAVSMTVTLILMIVLSLLVIGFAQVSRRNQRQALDQQLSTQAFYAAESGINAARNAIKNAGGAAIPKKDACTTGTGIFAGLNGTVDADSGVKYSCLLVDPSPPSLTFGQGSIGDRSTLIPLNAESGNLTSIKMVWKSDQPNPVSECPTSSAQVFSPAGNGSWGCKYGVLRFDLVPVTTADTMSIGSLTDSVMSTFAVPVQGAVGDTNTMNYAPGSADDIKEVKCSTSYCELTINISPGTPSMYMRMRSIYQNVHSLEISGTNESGPVGLTGAQALIDSTGKAQDVLRRIQVRVPITGSNQNHVSDYAVQTRDSLCKRFAVMSQYFASAVDPAYNNSVNGENPLCRTIEIKSPGASGNSGVGPCTSATSGCFPTGSTNSKPIKTWTRYVRNLSDNTAGVVSCTWTWGDGTKTENQWCNPGDVAKHEFPEIEKCTVYNIKLVLRLDNGAAPESESFRTYVPHGPGTKKC